MSIIDIILNSIPALSIGAFIGIMVTLRLLYKAIDETTDPDLPESYKDIFKFRSYIRSKRKLLEQVAEAECKAKAWENTYNTIAKTVNNLKEENLRLKNLRPGYDFDYIQFIWLQREYETLKMKYNILADEKAEYRDRMTDLESRLRAAQYANVARRSYSKDVIDAVEYAMKKAHPDNGGTNDEFIRFRKIYTQIRN